jgi:hypothetical protein
MRESSRTERMHLPANTYEEWLKAQGVKPAGTRLGKKITEDQYEIWLEKSVKRRTHKPGHHARA